jgi:hypothetical protein
MHFYRRADDAMSEWIVVHISTALRNPPGSCGKNYSVGTGEVTVSSVV